uniref:Uncharacterized protein n=1 Tax=Mimivirus LCMiAC02 TaxID=2506609 RepID=A0A481Z1E4_9VIRU|nr:MAG: uncharacterized protein LCMiAC02_00740 [Mimivirus LCMiAC02]
MIVIAFEKNILLGGLGDRIIGIISCKLIANLLKRDFYILWNKENIKEYLNYSKYDYELKKVKSKDVKIYKYIDKQKGLKKYLMNNTKLFGNEVNKFYLNQEISQYLYKNKLFKNRDYLKDIIGLYKELYSDILKPTDKIISIVNNLLAPYNVSNDVKKSNNIVGIQIRAGDKYMITNKGERYTRITDPNTKIKNIIIKIKSHCDKIYNDYFVFVTSDYPNIYNIFSQIWDPCKLIYLNNIIQHLDRKSVNNNISKVFVDSYILSQKTDTLYISKYSNFGRVAALSATHNNIFDLNTNPIKIKQLLSKHEMLF